MKNDEILWNQSSNRFVLYLDIMGFKERVSRTDFDEMKRSLTLLNDKWEKRISPLKLNDHLKYVEFSDSIIVSTDSDSEKCMNLITRAAITIMQETIMAGFGMRGAMACGKFCFDEKKHLFFGQPLVDAYTLEETICYYGVSVHHSAEKHVKEYIGTHNEKYYEKSDFPTKDGLVSCYQLNWADMDKKNQYADIRKEANIWLDKIEETVSGKPRTYVKNTRDVLTKTHHFLGDLYR